MAASKFQLQDVKDAAERIRGKVAKTPLEIARSRLLPGVNIYLKKDCLMEGVGSVKARGACNTLMQLTQEQKQRGVITSPCGNHSLALANYGTKLGVPVTVVLPTSAPYIKVEWCRIYNAKIIQCGKDLVEAKELAIRKAEEEGLQYVNGYNDLPILAGQGVAALEVLEQMDKLGVEPDTIVIPVGGGGLLAGMVTVIQHLKPNIKIIAVESEWCPSFTEAIKNGKPVKVDSNPDTLAAGLNVSMVGGNSFEIVRRYTNNFEKLQMEVVKEEHIKEGILMLEDKEGIVVEGGGAITLAACLHNLRSQLQGKNVVLMLTGGNIDRDKLRYLEYRGKFRREQTEIRPYSQDSIRGVEMIKETEISFLDQGGTFEWRGYGLRLHVPKGSLPHGMEECRINIKASFSGQFQLPEGSDLLSPVFWITGTCKFTKPVTLELQHCALTEDEAALSHLSFVSANCSQRDLPYRFRQLDWGVFTKHSSYGSIQLNRYSGIGIMGRKRTSRSYCAHLYYTVKKVYEWRFYFVITQDLDAKNTVVKEHYSHFAREEVTLRVSFMDGEITLNIPEDGLETREGWRIALFSHPTISRKDADQFKMGQWIPECQLIVQWEKEDQKPVQLRHRVDLIGAKPPYNFIHLTLDPAGGAPVGDTLSIDSTPLYKLISETKINVVHYEAYQRALKEGVTIPLRYLKVLFFGAPRTGKTSLRRRLVGEIQNLAKEPVQVSTGTAEHYDVIVKVVKDKTTFSTTVIMRSEWSSVKALFGKEKSPCVTDLDDELRLLHQFIYARTEKVSNPVTEEHHIVETTVEDNEEGATGQNLDMLNIQSLPEVSETVDTINPNTTAFQKVEELGYGLSNQKIEEAFEAFDKILRTGGQEKLEILLDGTLLMNMIDTGGQPAFLEMLPALTIGPALYLIFFRLDQELKKKYQIQYVSEDHDVVQLESSYTVEEVIFQALSSIACFSCIGPKKAHMPIPSHGAVLVGTHKDLLGSDPETEIKAKENALKKSLQDILDIDLFESVENFLHYASEDHLMFTIDNMKGDERELGKVHERLEEVIKQMFNHNNISIPASWLMFSIFLRRMGNRTLTLNECHVIGERLKVKDTDEALWFLHHCVGILMHFPDVEEIKDIVICDPQVIFDSVTNLILNSFKLKWVPKCVCDKFKNVGQFSLKDIQKIARNSKNESLPLPKLIKLLEHLNIIAPIKSESSIPLSDPYQEVYFMPAVLKHASEEELWVKHTDPAPLMIRFKCSFVPIGVFCAKIAKLVALGWKLLKPSDHYTLYKNKVTFRIDGAYDITLISKPKRYEVHIVCIQENKDRAWIKIRQDVLKTVCDTLDQVISKMKYEQYLTSSPSDQTLYELGFKCPEHPNDDHLVINRPKRGVETPSKSAKSLWLNYLKGKSIMICPLDGEKAVDLRDTRFSFQQSLVWFGEPADISSSPGSSPDAGDILLGEDDLRDVRSAVASLAGRWKDLGISLGVRISDLDGIASANPHSPSDCLREMLTKWLKQSYNVERFGEPTWRRLVEAVKDDVGGNNPALARTIARKHSGSQ